MKVMKSFFSGVGLLLFTGLVSFGQTQKDVVDAYNQGVKLLSSDTKGAINAFEKCVSLSDQVGEDANETKDLAIAQLPGLYYTLAVNDYKKKDLNGAIDGFKKAEKVAQQYGDQKIAGKCANIVPKLYYARGTSSFKQKNYDAALADFDEAIALNGKYTSPYLGKAMVYSKMDDFGKMKEVAEKGTEVGLAARDTKAVNQIEDLMQTESFNRAVEAINNNEMDQAEEYLRSSIEYGNNKPDVYYQLGKIYQSKKDYSKAEENLKKAITLDNGQDIVKAKYYYVLGEVYKAVDKKQDACDAFKKALFPPYEESAKYEIEQVLKCQ